MERKGVCVTAVTLECAESHGPNVTTGQKYLSS
jgi:hypothetical protein